MKRESGSGTWPSWSFTRIGLLIGVPVAVVVGVNAVAWAAATLKSWNTGDTLTAADLNANFTALNRAFVDLTSDQPNIAGSKTFTGNVAVNGTMTAGTAAVTGTLTAGNAGVGGTLSVGGTTNLGPTVNVGGTLNVGGIANVGVRMFDQNPANPGSCRHLQTGIFDCDCPTGTSVIGGGAFGSFGAYLLESRPVSTATWRVACRDASTNSLVDCAGFSFVCARLGS